MQPYFETKNGKLYHGDCLEILPELEPVDLVLTDPPYGVKRDRGFGGATGFAGKGAAIARREYPDSWDSAIPLPEVFELLLDKAPLSLIFGGNYFAHILPQSTHWIVWDKKNTMPTFGDAELIWTNSTRKSIKIVTFEYNGLIGKETARVHPTQKPMLLIANLIEQYLKGQVVLDPYFGSGTTGVACEELNRKWIGIEISEKYCEIAAKRIEHETQQLRLFA